eukprot:scaffold870_cov393-Prasinococcus_capsulatus_cf.AAC.32
MSKLLISLLMSYEKEAGTSWTFVISKFGPLDLLGLGAFAWRTCHHRTRARWRTQVRRKSCSSRGPSGLRTWTMVGMIFCSMTSMSARGLRGEHLGGSGAVHLEGKGYDGGGHVLLHLTQEVQPVDARSIGRPPCICRHCGDVPGVLPAGPHRQHLRAEDEQLRQATVTVLDGDALQAGREALLAVEVDQQGPGQGSSGG